MSDDKIIKILVFAMGGEGGLTLARWLTHVAESDGYRIQHTSLPGVAQRTGATSYYFEMIRETAIEAAGVAPVFSLEPAPGDVDVVFASELLEAVRAVDLGFVTADRTTLITSSHREFLYSEKSVSGDGILSKDALLDRLKGSAKQVLIGDFKAAAKSSGAWLSPVLFGALAASSALPFAESTFRVILAASSSENLAGFDAGVNSLKISTAREPEDTPLMPSLDNQFMQAIDNLPMCARDMSRQGVARLLDYQGPKYAKTYLNRVSNLAQLVGDDTDILEEFSRLLALWMSYEDVIRVAQLKTRRSRLLKLRETSSGDGSIIRVVDFLRPGWQEFTSLLPAFIARPLSKSNFASRAFEKLVPPLKINTTSFLGFTALVFLRSLRIYRPLTSRYDHENALIEKWVISLGTAHAIAPDVAKELVQCPTLIKGYGKVRDRGEDHFLRIMAMVSAGDIHAAQVAALRQAASDDPSGKMFDELSNPYTSPSRAA